MKSNVTKEQAQACRACTDKIASAIAGLGEVENQRTKIAGNISGIEQEIIRRVNSMDPEDEMALDGIVLLRGRLTELRSWIANARPLLTCVDKIHVALNEAKSLIPTVVQARSAEEGPMAACVWANVLTALPAQDVLNRVQTIRETAQNCLHDLKVICEARRPCPLRHDEIETGVLRDGSVSVRQLTPQERISGFANA